MAGNLRYFVDSSDSEFGFSSSSFYHSRPESGACFYNDLRYRKKRYQKPVSSTTPSPPATPASRARSESMSVRSSSSSSDRRRQIKRQMSFHHRERSNRHKREGRRINRKKCQKEREMRRLERIHSNQQDQQLTNQRQREMYQEEPEPSLQQQSRPCLPIPQQQSQPCPPIPQQKPRPCVPIPQQQSRPCLPIPQQQSQPCLPIPQQQSRPCLPIPQQQSRPCLPIPGQSFHIQPIPFEPQPGPSNQKQPEMYQSQPPAPRQPQPQGSYQPHPRPPHPQPRASYQPQRSTSYQPEHKSYHQNPYQAGCDASYQTESKRSHQPKHEKKFKPEHKEQYHDEGEIPFQREREVLPQDHEMEFEREYGPSYPMREVSYQQEMPLQPERKKSYHPGFELPCQQQRHILHQGDHEKEFEAERKQSFQDRETSYQHEREMSFELERKKSYHSERTIPYQQERDLLHQQERERAHRQNRKNVHAAAEQEPDQSELSNELEEASRRSMPEILTAMDNMIALFSPRNTLRRTPVGGPAEAGSAEGFGFEPDPEPKPDFGRIQRRRNSPVQFTFIQNRLPLSPPLIWWAKQGYQPSEEDLINNPQVAELPPFALPNVRPQVSISRGLNRLVSPPPFNSTIPKLPKIENARRVREQPESRRERNPDENTLPRLCPPMTRLEKMSGVNHNPVRLPPVPVEPLRYAQAKPNLRSVEAARPLPPIADQRFLPHCVLAEPMRFRPVFVKPPKQPTPLARTYLSQPLPPIDIPGGSSKPGGAKKELPNHLRFGNFNIKRNERRAPVELPPLKSGRGTKNKHRRN